MAEDKLVRLLLLEDTEDDALLILRALRLGGVRVDYERVFSREDLCDALDRRTWDIVVSDHTMPGFDGLTALKCLREKGKDIPFILVSGTIGEEVAVKAMRVGVSDYLMKDNLARLAPAVERELAEAEKRRRSLEVERQLVQSEEKYRLIFDSVTDAMFILDEEGNLLEVNEVACTELERSRKSLLAMNMAELAWHKDGDLVRRMLGEARPGQRTLFESAMLRTDGEQVPVEINVQLIPYGRGTAYLVVARNSAERLLAAEEKKRLESQLLEAQKLEAVGQLAGGIAHDFNNLLTGITGYAGLAMMEVESGSEMSEMLKEIQLAADRATHLTKQLLAFSRKQLHSPETLNINNAVSNTMKVVPGLLGTQIDLDVRLDTEVCRVYMDPTQVEQILLNLVVNARDAMPEGGRLTVATSCARTNKRTEPGGSWSRLGPGMCLSVSDTGVGMERDVAERAFEPFFTTKERGKGTGLGLSTVYGIVKQNGGDIEVDSTLGKGTTFYVYFPEGTENQGKAPADIRSLLDR